MTESKDHSKAKSAFHCPQCKREFRWKPELAGKRVKCPCGNKLEIPAKPAAARNPAPKPKPKPKAEESGGMDWTALAAMEAAAGSAEPVVEMPEGDWMDQAAKSRQSGRARVKAERKASRASGGDWGKLHISDTLVFGIDVTGMFTSGGSEWSRIDILVGYAMRFTLLVVGGLALILYAMNRAPIDEQFKANATPTVATITSKPEVSKGGKKTLWDPEKWKFTCTVEIEVDGTKYTDEVEAAGSKFPADFDREQSDQWQGRQVDVLYDAKNPSEIRLTTDAGGTAQPLFMIGGGICLLLGGFHGIMALNVLRG